MTDFPKGINDNLLGNITYRENVVTGTISVDNGNYTYDVFIAGEDTAIKNIHTNQKYPEYSTGDSVLLNLEYGSKDMPIITGYSKKIVQEVEEVDMNVLVTTLDAYGTSQSSSWLEGRIEDIDGYENCLLRGFHYGLTTAYGTDTYSTGSFAVGSYALQTTGLTGNTAYNFQAYVYDADGDEQGGENMTFVTGLLTGLIYSVWEDTSNDVWLLQHDGDGNLLNTWEIELTENIGNPIAVDTNENVYTITSDQNSIKKRNRSGTLTLTKTETNLIYNIVAASDGYIYTFETDSGVNSFYISKRNASDLVSVGTKTVDAAGIKTYYGMTVDSANKFYMVNNSDSRYETWDFAAGLEANSTGTIEKTFASLAVVNSDFVNIDWGGGGHGILLPKDYSDGGVGSDVAFTDISRPYNLGTKDGNCLVIGIEPNQMLIGKYNSSLAKVWTTVISTGGYSGTVGIAAYPF